MDNFNTDAHREEDKRRTLYSDATIESIKKIEMHALQAAHAKLPVPSTPFIISAAPSADPMPKSDVVKSSRACACTGNCRRLDSLEEAASTSKLMV